MKFNKQKIEDIKGKVKNIKAKITSSEKSKVPKKYYGLLILMLLLGMTTLSKNISEYNKSRREDFKEYELENRQVDSVEVEVTNYQIAESSISTTEPNMEEEQVIETISSNSKTDYIMPIDGEITKEYATEKLVYSETLGMWKTHPGIDIKAKLGEQVKSVSNGIVQSVEQDSFYGNTVKILDNQGYIFVYSNLDNNIVLKEGEKVERGDVIGIVGVSAAGELADETHLHFEVIKDEIQVNPLDLIN